MYVITKSDLEVCNCWGPVDKMFFLFTCCRCYPGLTEGTKHERQRGMGNRRKQYGFGQHLLEINMHAMGNQYKAEKGHRSD